MVKQVELAKPTDKASPEVKRLLTALEEALALQDHIAQMEADVSAATQALIQLREEVIPDCLATMGTDRYHFRGFDVQVGQYVRGSLPKDDARRKAAIAWLVANGGGNIVKTSVAVAFPLEDHSAAEKLATRLEKAGFAPKVDSGVHPSTLAAYARERIENGEPLDEATLGLMIGLEAKFKKAKS